ncbi:MAG: outer membrane protein, partial [Akkermansiaceae bacterium]
KTKIIHVLLEQQVIDTLSQELTKNVDAFEAANDLDVRIVPISPKDISLSNLPSDAKAVYIPVLPTLTDKQRFALFTTLTQRNKIHLSMLGPDDVDAGAFASVAPRLTETLHRRLGLNLHQALLGVNTTHLPVILRLADQLKINLATAREIGWSPDYDTTLSATFFKQDEIQKSSGSLTLESAMAMAAKRNPDIKAAKASWLSSLADVRSGIAQYATTADLVGQAGTREVHSRNNPFLTPRQAGAISLGVEVNKLLYSDQLYQQIEALSERAEAVKLETQSVALDTIETTAHAYLNTLFSETLYNIQRKNVLLIQENLGLAEIRREIGAQDNTDALRWQAALASARSNLIRSDSNRRNARINLNIILATDAQKHWALKDIKLDDQQTYFLDESFSDLVSNQKGFQGFIRFSRALASANAPELKSFDFNLRAEGIRFTERNRRNKRPQIALTASAQSVFEDSSATPSGAQTEWTVGIGFTLPFLEKDLREADLSKIQAGILQLQAQRQRAVYLIEQRALAACFNMAASHPAMRLSRRALYASEKNYDGVREKYSLGQANVVTLIDAQSNLLAQEQAEADATYSYLKDAISLQRSLAWFEYSKSKPQVADFIQHYHDFQKTGSAHVRVIKK